MPVVISWVGSLWGRKIDHFLPHKNCHTSTHPQPLHIPFPCPYLVPGSIAGFAKPNNSVQIVFFLRQLLLYTWLHLCSMLSEFQTWKKLSWLCHNYRQQLNTAGTLAPTSRRATKGELAISPIILWWMRFDALEASAVLTENMQKNGLVVIVNYMGWLSLFLTRFNTLVEQEWISAAYECMGHEWFSRSQLLLNIIW